MMDIKAVLNKKNLNISTWFTVLSILIFPADVQQVGSVTSYAYGFPIKYFIEYSGTKEFSQWFLVNSFVHLGELILSLVINYFIVSVIIYIIAKLRNYHQNRNLINSDNSNSNT